MLGSGIYGKMLRSHKRRSQMQIFGVSGAANFICLIQEC
jgi:hypothetical protein